MRAAEWLWDNPLLQRERTRRPAAGRVRAVAPWVGVALVLALYGVSSGWLSRPGRTPGEARSFLAGLCLIYLLVVTAAAPGPAAAAIAGERERRTWESIFLSHLRPSQIVAGKYLVSLAASVAVLVTMLPPLLMGIHAARLPWSHALPLLLVLGTAPVAVVALALWLSGLFRRTRGALAASYVLTGALFWLSTAWSAQLLVRGENLWWYLSPAWQAAVLCLGEPSRSPLARPLLPEWAWFVLFYLALTAGCLAMLTRRIARRAE